MILGIQIRESHADSKSYFYILLLACRHHAFNWTASVFSTSPPLPPQSKALVLKDSSLITMEADAEVEIASSH